MTTKQQALELISDIRSIQDIEHSDHIHSIPEWLIILETQVNKAKVEWYKRGNNAALQRIKHIGACACAAIEQNGVINDN